MNVPPDNPPLLGCIADDVTGATDLASNLVLGGMRTVQVFGVPEPETLAQIDADAVVIALKSRSIGRDDAIAQSLRSLNALRQRGVERFFFKYCSTFDSTPEGNIGPVAEALMEALGIEQTVFVPAFPRNGRTVYQGHLFVHGRLLSESGMENHPLNPMTDANLLRVLGRQATKPIGLLPYEIITSGDARSKLRSLADAGDALVITDACDDRHLESLARDIMDMRLVTGGSGIARYLPQAWRESGLHPLQSHEVTPPSIGGRTAILSGSCSAATNRQVAYMKTRCPSFALDVEAIVASPEKALTDIATWLKTAPVDDPILFYSTSQPERVAELQRKFGSDAVARSIEDFFGTVAEHLVQQQSVRRLILAGGETSGAVTTRLGVKSIRIGPEVCPGVPWTESHGPDPLALVLKSGNFGEDNFFESAMEMLP